MGQFYLNSNTEKYYMHTMLLQILLREQKIGYVIANHHLTVLDYGGYLTMFIGTQDFPMPSPLLDFIPELNGCEDILQDILEGVLPRFELENINRTLPNNELCYLNLTLLHYEPQTPNHTHPQLLITITDHSTWAQTQQTLTQQRNELSLLKNRLNETNQHLEFLLQYYVPREVGRALMENRIVPELGGEEREISILFADLRNYTSMSEKLKPNETIEMLHVYLDIATSAIAEAGGVVVNYMGDAVMAILLYFGVGINTGTTIVGNIGAQWHYQYTAVGDTVNVASRICSYARPNEVLIGSDTYTYIQDCVTAQALSPLKFKGKRQEITVYQVTALAENTLIETLIETLKKTNYYTHTLTAHTQLDPTILIGNPKTMNM